MMTIIGGKREKGDRVADARFKGGNVEEPLGNGKTGKWVQREKKKWDKGHRWNGKKNRRYRS